MELDVNELMDDSDLYEISGGSSPEFDVLVRWIRDNDPKHYSPDMDKNRILVVRWLKENVPGFKKCSFHQNGSNEYYLADSGNDPLNNFELITLLDKTYGK